MLTDLIKEKQRLDRELGIAIEIQSHLLPLQLPVIEGYDISAINRPCLELGGDYFDAFAVGDNFIVVIADVSGKGIGAALLMSNLQAMVHSLAQQVTDPAALLERINSDLISRVGDGMFITLFCLVLAPWEGKARFSNAGHNPPLLHRKYGEIVPLEASGLPLGIFENGSYEAFTIEFEPGDALILYTDGITECTNKTGELFLEERLKAVLSQNCQSGAQFIQSAICSAVDNFRQETPFSDDVTLVVLKRSPRLPLRTDAPDADRPGTDANAVKNDRTMSPISFGKLDFKIGSSMYGVPEAPMPDAPFRILLMGDFSGRADRGISRPGAALTGRNLHRVDRDNLEEVMAGLGVEIRLPLPGKEGLSTSIKFSEMDDFHPDRLFERLDVFTAIRDKRAKLADPGYSDYAVGEGVGRKAVSGPLPVVLKAGSSRQELPVQTTGSLLDEVLQETAGKGVTGATGGHISEWDGFLNRIVQPYLVTDTDKRQSELIAALDAATGEMMRAILHYPVFQELEAAWRGLEFLVFRLETGEELMIYLLDVSKKELADDLMSTDALTATDMYRLIIGGTVETPGADPWALLAAQYTFDSCREDVEMLGRLSKIASAAGAPFIGAAGERTLLDTGGNKGWEALRQLPSSPYLGLASPRFLLRLPYGAKTFPVECFDFEEMDIVPEHDHYLWGNPSLACACLLGQAFAEYGWDFRPGVFQEIDDLPLHVFRDGGESRMTPCAEKLFTQEVAEEILGRGFMLLLSFKDRDMVRLARFQSVACPAVPLAGRWHC